MYCILCYEFGKEATHVATDAFTCLLKVLHREGFCFCFVCGQRQYPLVTPYVWFKYDLRQKYHAKMKQNVLDQYPYCITLGLEILVTRLFFVHLCATCKINNFFITTESQAICESQYHPFIFYVTRMEILMI